MPETESSFIKVRIKKNKDIQNIDKPIFKIKQLLKKEKKKNDLADIKISSSQSKTPNLKAKLKEESKSKSLSKINSLGILQGT